MKFSQQPNHDQQLTNKETNAHLMTFKQQPKHDRQLTIRKQYIIDDIQLATEPWPTDEKLYNKYKIDEYLTVSKHGYYSLSK
jgi:hypothetical protein